MMLRAIKSNQNRMSYTGYQYQALYAGRLRDLGHVSPAWPARLLAATDPLAGAERMQWTASGEVVLMTILGGAGTLLGPVLGAGLIKYFENIFSAYQRAAAAPRLRLPARRRPRAAWSRPAGLFVGEGWQLTLGLLFMLVVIFLPGGIMEGINRLLGLKHTPKVKSLGDSPQRDGLGESVIEDMPVESRRGGGRDKAAENKAAEKKRAVAP